MLKEINSATKANVIQLLLETLEKPLSMTQMEISDESWSDSKKYTFTLSSEGTKLTAWLTIKNPKKTESEAA